MSAYEYFTQTLEKNHQERYKVSMEQTIAQEALLLFEAQTDADEYRGFQYISKPLLPMFEEFLDNLYINDQKTFSKYINTICDYHIEELSNLGNNDWYNKIQFPFW